LTEEQQLAEFNAVIMPHLDAAYNYARWLTRDAHDAEDLTQEACVRAFANFQQFKKQYPKAWLLTILRHTFLNQAKQKQRRGEVVYLDSLSHKDSEPAELNDAETPERILLRHANAELLRTCIDRLADEHREIIILRELEGLSYHEIAQIADCPMGTVMSRLSRARTQLKSMLVSMGCSREVTA
jgi:RNA polymerase sigma-70 factor (ECF subfamily)